MHRKFHLNVEFLWLPRGVAEFPSLETFKSSLDTFLCHVHDPAWAGRFGQMTHCHIPWFRYYFLQSSAFSGVGDSELRTTYLSRNKQCSDSMLGFCMASGSSDGGFHLCWYDDAWRLVVLGQESHPIAHFDWDFSRYFHLVSQLSINQSLTI